MGRAGAAVVAAVAAAVLAAACSSEVVHYDARPVPESFPGDTLLAVAAPPTPPAGSAPSSGPAAPTATSTPLPASTTTTALAPFAARSYETGECVTWSTDVVPRDVQTVPCDAPHLLEVAGAVDVLEPAGPPGAPYPAEEAWRSVTVDRCRPVLERHLGRPLDPGGRYTAFGLRPTPETWAAGDRRLWCGVAVRDDRLDPAGEESSLQLTAGRADGADQVLLFPPGTCLYADDAAGRGAAVVPCTEQHVYEVVGSAEVRGDRRPEDEEWPLVLRAECATAARAYLGRELDPPEREFWFLISVRSWDAGKRHTECLVSMADAAGRPQISDRPLAR